MESMFEEDEPIYKVLSPGTLSLALCLSLFAQFFHNRKTYLLPQIISEFLNEREMDIKELTVLKQIITNCK